MTREETKKIVMMVKTAYPNWRPDDLTFTVNAWATFLKDYQYKDVEAALCAYVTTDISGFAPSIGQVIAKIHIADEYNSPNEMEAWSMVSKALRNGYYGAEQEFEKLPVIVQKAVGTPSNLRNWSQTDVESVENVIQSNFIRSYRAEVKKQSELKRMPEEIRNLITSTSQNMIGIETGGDNREKRESGAACQGNGECRLQR